MVELLATDSLAILGQARVFPDSTLHTPGPAAGTGNITLTVEGLVRERERERESRGLAAITANHL